MISFDPEQAQVIRSILSAENNLRDLILFNVGLDKMLCASDLIKLTIADMTDHEGAVVAEVTLPQKKTSHGHVVALGPESRETLLDWLTVSDKPPEDPISTSIGNRKTGCVPSREQCANLTKKWAGCVRLDPKRYSTHAVRRSQAALIYENTHNLPVCQQLLGHKNIGSTACYLGVDQRKALDLAQRIKI